MEAETDHWEQEQGDEEQEQGDEEEEEEDFGLILPKRQKRDDGPPSRHTTFSKTSDACFRLIQEAMYRNRWRRAAGLFTSYVQTLESQTTEDLRRAPEILWHLGSEILLNHPKTMPGDMNLFNETIKNIGVKTYLLVSLEQVYSLLCGGQMEEAHRTMSTTESWRFGRISIAQNELLKLIQAYRAVLDYWAWMDKKAAMADNESDYTSQTSTIKDMSGLFRQARVGFQGILHYPGVWDPFVLNYVNLLESSGNMEEAEEVLMEYAYNKKNPANPNPHVYLYEFRKRRGDSPQTLIEVLKVLHALVPSHKLMLEFSDLLRKSDSDEHHRLALHVLFDLLDFSGWKDDPEVWKCFTKNLKICLKCGRTSWISEAWTSRSVWWPSYHFAPFQAKKDWGKCAGLAVRKATASGVLQGPDCAYFSSVYKLGDGKQRKALDRAVKVGGTPD